MKTHKYIAAALGVVLTCACNDLLEKKPLVTTQLRLRQKQPLWESIMFS